MKYLLQLSDWIYSRFSWFYENGVVTFQDTAYNRYINRDGNHAEIGTIADMKTGYLYKMVNLLFRDKKYVDLVEFNMRYKKSMLDSSNSRGIFSITFLGFNELFFVNCIIDSESFVQLFRNNPYNIGGYRVIDGTKVLLEVEVPYLAIDTILKEWQVGEFNLVYEILEYFFMYKIEKILSFRPVVGSLRKL